jgi:hypothetical protein
MWLAFWSTRSITPLRRSYSRSISAAELMGYVPSRFDQQAEPPYRVKVTLAAQTITAYGKQQQLRKLPRQGHS